MKKVLVGLAVVAFLAASGAWAENGVTNEVDLLVNVDPVATILVDAVPEADDLAENYVAGPGVYSLNVTTPGTGPYTFGWSSPDGGGAAIAPGDELTQSPVLNLAVLPAGVYTFECAVSNVIGPMNPSNVVTLALYDHAGANLTSVPAAAPPAPANGVAENNNGLQTVFTVTGFGGWGAAPVLTLGLEYSDDGGISWNPVVADAEHVLDSSVPNVLTYTINPTAVVDARKYRGTYDDGHI